MEIKGLIKKGLTYQKVIESKVKTIDESISSTEIDLNKLPKAVSFERDGFSVARWTSPKRTRTYPYSLIYDIFDSKYRKVAIIPVVKDEGKDGDRDFIQWDTIALMSLLNTYVILAYYTKAERNKKYKNKITHQEFDNFYIKRQLNELKNYHNTPLHWNMEIQIKENLSTCFSKAMENYQRISKELNVEFHNMDKLEEICTLLQQDLEKFQKLSRKKAISAQIRETQTQHPLESIDKSEKAKIDIENFQGGIYNFTCDTVRYDKLSNKILLIENKNSTMKLLPSKGDIKDGLVKIMVYLMIDELFVNEEKFDFKPVLKITSSSHECSVSEIKQNSEILSLNFFSKQERKFLEKLIEEADINGFEVWYEIR